MTSTPQTPQKYFRVEYQSRDKWFPAWPGQRFTSHQVGPAVRKARQRWANVRSVEVPPTYTPEKQP